MAAPSSSLAHFPPARTTTVDDGGDDTEAEVTLVGDPWSRSGERAVATMGAAPALPTKSDVRELRPRNPADTQPESVASRKREAGPRFARTASGVVSTVKVAQATVTSSPAAQRAATPPSVVVAPASSTAPRAGSITPPRPAPSSPARSSVELDITDAMVVPPAPPVPAEATAVAFAPTVRVDTVAPPVFEVHAPVFEVHAPISAVHAQPAPSMPPPALPSPRPLGAPRATSDVDLDEDVLLALPPRPLDVAVRGMLAALVFVALVALALVRLPVHVARLARAALAPHWSRAAEIAGLRTRRARPPF